MIQSIILSKSWDFKTFEILICQITIFNEISNDITQNTKTLNQNKCVKTAKAFSFSTATHRISNDSDMVSNIVSIIMYGFSPKPINEMAFNIIKGTKVNISTIENAYQEYSHSTDLESTKEMTIGKQYKIWRIILII